MAWDESIKKQFKYCGENTYVGHYCIFTNPSEVILHDRCRIDPFTFVSTALEMGSNSHICSHAVLSGGREHKITLEGANFIGYGSKLFCASEDYSGETGPVGDYWFENKIYRGDITLKKFSGVASDVILFPMVQLPIGCTIGAKSLVHSKSIVAPWSIYLGNPLKFHKLRTATEERLKEKWR